MIPCTLISMAKTTHARKGEIHNRFQYELPMFMQKVGETLDKQSWLGGIFKISPRHYGSKLDRRNVAIWVRDQFDKVGLTTDYELYLITQPRIWRLGFNPVSFWIAKRARQTIAIIAEVNNTFSQRHFYLCAQDELRAISPSDRLVAQKVFYVSPFQEIAGNYHFQVNFSEDRFNVKIELENQGNGVIATLSGKFQPITSSTLLRVAMLRPWSGIRVYSLIFYQAAKLKFKGATYRTRPHPPSQELSK